jgi:hypothetical protein
MAMPNTYKKGEKDPDYFFYLRPSQDRKGTFKPKQVENL